MLGIRAYREARRQVSDIDRCNLAFAALTANKVEYPETMGDHVPVVNNAYMPTNVGCRKKGGPQDVFIWVALLSNVKYNDEQYKVIDSLTLLLPECSNAFGRRIDVATHALKTINNLYPEVVVIPTVHTHKRSFAHMGLTDAAIYRYAARNICSTFVTLPIGNRGSAFGIIEGA